tara:strand:+ start:9296 stop:10234 length:939 start_codon:yes stop_codon:yes gene_type:complete
MSIIQRVPGTRLMPLNGMSSQLIAQTLDLEATTVPTTLVSECVGALPVFGDLFSDDLQNNDFTSFLAYQRPGTTVSFKLFDGNCNFIANLNTSDYGLYYPINYFGSGFTFFQNNYLGYKLEWQKVLNLHGPGTYKIQIKTLSNFIPAAFEPIEECSCFFELLQYSNSFADETVRIETTQNGYIIGEGLDYTNINWKEQIRIPGFFGNKQRRLEQDNYLDKNRRTTQIQDSLIHEFTLEPYFWPDCLRDQIDSILLANEILVSDYNRDNTDNLKNISVIPTTIETEYFGKSNKAADEIKFEERRKNRVKRNVK